MGQFKRLEQKLKVLNFIINNNPVIEIKGKVASISFTTEELKFLKKYIDNIVDNGVECECILNEELKLKDCE
jgi:hypothetical protein